MRVVHERHIGVYCGTVFCDAIFHQAPLGIFVEVPERDEIVRICMFGMCLKIQILVCFLARINVCKVRQEESGFVPTSL